MLTEFKYKPLSQQPDIATTIQRDRIGKWVRFSEKREMPAIADITIIRSATQQEQEGTCFNYALAQTTGNTIPLTLYEDSPYQTSTINIENYFNQTLHPQTKDLVLYTAQENDRKIDHCATFINNNLFESKFGKSSKIVHHTPFAIPHSYGYFATYWTLKPKFKNNQEKLLKTIRNEAENFNNERFAKKSRIL
jgi:hypothetical protein